MSALRKPCSCGLVYDQHAWSCLPYVGRMVDEVEALELWNCGACASTLTVDISDDRADFADEWAREVSEDLEREWLR